MRTKKLILPLALGALLLSPTLKLALDNFLMLFILVVIVNFIIKFIRAFWVPLLFIAAMIYLSS